jgi:hypothetical protein
MVLDDVINAMLPSLWLMNVLTSGFQVSSECKRRSKVTNSSATVLLYVAETEAGAFAFFRLRLPFSPIEEEEKDCA